MMSYLLGEFFCCISFLPFKQFLFRGITDLTRTWESGLFGLWRNALHILSSTHKSHWMNIHFCNVWFKKRSACDLFFTSRPHSAKWLPTSLKQLLLLLSIILTMRVLLRRRFEVDLTGVAWKPPAWRCSWTIPLLRASTESCWPL